MFEALRSYTRGRRCPAALALPPLLLALAVLLGANPAAAQLPEVEVYHSPNNEGDRASETVPPSAPGCDCSAAVGSGDPVTIDFDEFNAGDIVTGQIDEAYFYTTSGREVITLPEAIIFGTSSPNIIAACQETEEEPGYDCSAGEIFINFSELAHDLSFLVVGDNDVPPGTVVAQVNVFESGWLEGTVDIVVDGAFETTHLVDLSEFGCISRIHIHNMTDPQGIGFDDFSFYTEALCDCVVQGGTNERIDLFVDGGVTESNPLKTVCMKGEEGGDGHELCGADIQLSLEGFGSFSNFVGDDTLNTLVHNPPCDYTDEGGDCEALPDGTKQLRMNFRRGGVTPTAEPRRVGRLEVNSTGASLGNPTKVVVSGVAAAGANLQMRLIQPQVVAEGPSTVNCIPEPGEMMLLVSGLAGLALLYRLRGRP